MNQRQPELTAGQIVNVNEFGLFKVERIIDVGGMGAVYQFVREGVNKGRRYAAKTVRPEFLQRPGMLERFKREAAVLVELNHENILPVHGLFWTTDTEPRLPLIFMDLLKGNTLRKVVDIDEAIPTYFVCSVALGVLTALQELHPRGIVHRDIKPENIFLHERGKTRRVLLMDFGIVKEMREGAAEDSEGYFIGSFGYAPPEQLTGRAVTAKSDLYALSVVLYEMLANRALFPDATNPQSLGRAHIGQAPTPLQQLRPDVPPAICDMIMRGLAKNPEHRPADAFVYAAPFSVEWHATARSAGNSTIERLLSNTVAGEPTLSSRAVTPNPNRGNTLRMRPFEPDAGPTRTVTAPNVPPVGGFFPGFHNVAEVAQLPTPDIRATLPSGVAPSPPPASATSSAPRSERPPALVERESYPAENISARERTVAKANDAEPFDARSRASTTDPTSTRWLTREIALPSTADDTIDEQLPRTRPARSRGPMLALIASIAALLATIAVVKATWVTNAPRPSATPQASTEAPRRTAAVAAVPEASVVASAPKAEAAGPVGAAALRTATSSSPRAEARSIGTATERAPEHDAVAREPVSTRARALPTAAASAAPSSPAGIIDLFEDIHSPQAGSAPKQPKPTAPKRPGFEYHPEAVK